MNNCAQYWDLISAAVDGALTPEEEQRLQAHLAECPDCRAMLEQLQGLAEDLGEVTAAPAGFAGRVMEAAERTPQEIPFTNLPQNQVDYAPARQRVKDWWRPIRHACAIAACCLLILGLGTMLTRFGLFAGGGSAGGGPRRVVPRCGGSGYRREHRGEQRRPGDTPGACHPGGGLGRRRGGGHRRQRGGG